MLYAINTWLQYTEWTKLLAVEPKVTRDALNRISYTRLHTATIISMGISYAMVFHLMAAKKRLKGDGVPGNCGWLAR